MCTISTISRHFCLFHSVLLADRVVLLLCRSKSLLIAEVDFKVENHTNVYT